LTSITIPDSVTSIEDWAFAYCSGLTNIIIPESVTSISFGAFAGCNSLESMTLPFVGEELNGTNNTHFGYIFGAPPNQNPYNQNSFIPASLKNLTIERSTTGSRYTIPDTAFFGCRLKSVTIKGNVDIGFGSFVFSGLTSVTIGEGVETIGESAFYNCDLLTSITISASVTSIGGWAFASCYGLTSVMFVDNSMLTSIGEYAFLGCESLTGIDIPEGVTSIGEGAFGFCISLTSVIMPNVTYIGDEAFYNCGGLTSIVISGSVEYIGDFAFGECYSLDTVYYGGADQTAWNGIDIGEENELLTNATIYYYSDVQILGGTHWRWVNNVPTVW